MYTLKHVSMKYQQKDGAEAHALSDINLSIGSGDRWVIIGPSGSGKTTLLMLLAGLLQPTAGHILLDGHPLNATNQEISLILQDYGLFPWKTVFQNASLGLSLRGLPEKEIEARVLDLLDILGLLPLKNRFPVQLSGGEKQRVAIARALAVQPSYLLMDEPFSALDALTREKLQDVVYRLWQTYNFTTLLVTHNIEEAVFLGSKIIILSHSPGKVTRLMNNLTLNSPDRSSKDFHKQCTLLRSLLEGDRLSV